MRYTTHTVYWKATAVPLRFKLGIATFRYGTTGHVSEVIEQDSGQTQVRSTLKFDEVHQVQSRKKFDRVRSSSIKEEVRSRTKYDQGPSTNKETSPTNSSLRTGR